MSQSEVLYAGNDAVLEVSGLRNTLTGAYLNAATVTASLADSAGTPVTGMAWPVTLAYVANSDGLYWCNLEADLNLTVGERYVLTVVADGGVGLKATWTIDCVVRVRRE